MDPGCAKVKEEGIGMLREVYDPEIPVDIYSLGLIYGIEVSVGTVAVPMYLSWIAVIVPAGLAAWAIGVNAFASVLGTLATLLLERRADAACDPNAEAAAMLAFDAPSREASCVRRSRTNTALQSLGLLNETQRLEMSRMLAQRLLREAGDDPLPACRCRDHGHEVADHLVPDDRRVVVHAQPPGGIAAHRHAAEQHAATTVRFLQVVGARLDRQPAGNLRHRRQ